MTHRSTLQASRLLIIATALAGAAAAAPLAASAQIATTRYAVGYVTNTPDLLAGVHGHVVFPAFGGVGFFVDAKFDIDSPRDQREYLSTMTAQQVQNEIQGVQFLDVDESWRSFNAGLIRPVTSSLMLYAGAGLAKKEVFRFFYDREEEVGTSGFMWVDSPPEEKTSVNALFGTFMRVSQTFAFQIGFETAPRGLTVGATIGYPGWY